MDELKKKVEEYQIELQNSGKKIASLEGEKQDLCKENKNLEDRLRILKEDFDRETREREGKRLLFKYFLCYTN